MTTASDHKPLILITNDDGHQAKGLRKLITLMKPLGEVVVISTDKVMSAKGHSITTSPTLGQPILKNLLGDSGDVVVEMVEIGIEIIAVETESDGINAVHTGFDGSGHSSGVYDVD